MNSLVQAVPAAALSLAEDAPKVNLNSTQLLISIVVGVAVLIALVSFTKIHPFIAITIASFVAGIGSGYGLMNTVEGFSSGFGSTAASVGMLVGFGAMLGKVLMDTGATGVLVDTLLAKTPDRFLPWTMALIGALLGLPLFFDVGVIILVPVVVMVARKARIPLMRVAIPTLAGVSTMQALVPPHPGPVAALSSFENGNMGLTMGIGVLIAIPVVAVAGPLFAKVCEKWVPKMAPETGAVVQEDIPTDANYRRPSFGLSLLCIIMPAILLLITSAIEIINPGREGIRGTWTAAGAVPEQSRGRPAAVADVRHDRTVHGDALLVEAAE
ncbi:GntP family permease [Bifidobacterium catulorum]|uniref:Gluconate transporter n=1 Tax=Bifidobacterium catulorum TaxID=1630173 RepID=A0A2U2MRW5_9BIFI|nr:SLC13 family permease [Bifidobacterium catulorum]PWG59574.1 hypothetical protein DF200_06750 [Bifidobacterium catulorum]